MNCKPKVKKNECSFQWKIENFSYCWHKQRENFYSPSFVVDMKEKATKWKLVLCPKGYTNPSFVSFGLQRIQDDSIEDTIELQIDFSFISADHSTSWPLNPQSFRGSFHKNQIFLYPLFMKLEDLFLHERATLMPQNTLTVRCNLRRVDGESIPCVHIFARTIIQIEEMNFNWVINEFNNLKVNQKVHVIVKSVTKDSLATLNLFLTGQYGNEAICIEIIYSHKRLKLFKIQSYLLDAKNTTIDYTRQEYCFNVISKSDKYTFLLTKRKLLEFTENYLPNGVLSLRFHCTASTGIALERIERVDLGPNSLEETLRVKRKLPESPLKDDLKSILCDGFMSDMMLRIGADTFPVHTIILSARSPVFRSMFNADMKEKNEKCVDITDMDSATLRRLLLYIYTDTMEDLNFETAIQLYEASDKYSILTLKYKCSTFMKEHLDSSNVCQVLVVADLHLDEDLKLVVQDYILEHDYKVLNSEDWKQLMESNSKLTSETMFHKFKKLKY